MRADLQEIGGILKAADHILLLSHMKPDGDTLGSAFGLKYALEKLGKTVRVECSDGFPKRYQFIYPDAQSVNQPDFTPSLIVSVDIADTKLLGKNSEKYAECVDVCIDHHPSNTQFADKTFVDAGAASTSQIVAELVELLGVPLDALISTALYTGICTDTGCFKYSNTTAKTHRIAAKLIDAGVDSAMINRVMFDTKSKARMQVETLIMETLEYSFDGRVATIVITDEMVETTGVQEEELEGISAMPRCIEGVEVGVTFRQKPQNSFRVSLRTSSYISASEVCASFGGGGHVRAAGCMLHGTISQAKEMMRAELEKQFARIV